MAYDPEKVAQLKHIGSLASAISNTISTLDGKKFGDAAIADGKLKFFANVGDTTAIKELDLPEEIFLDQMQTAFVQSFVFSAATYPGATNPNLDGKPVLVLAVKGDKATNPTLTYSFVNLEKLIDTYTAGNGIAIADNVVSVKLDPATDNTLSVSANGLKGTAKVAGATQGNIAIFGADGVIVDSGSKFATDAEVAELINQYFPTVQGGNGIDTIISGTGNNSLIGNNGADIFVYSGGNDTIGDYTSKDDDISLTADGLLNFANYTFSGDNVIISGTEGNSLTILNGKGKTLTVIDASGNKRDYSYKEPEPESDGVLNEPQTAITLPASRTEDFTPTAEKYPRLATIDASAVTVPIAVSAVDSIASCLIAGATGISLFGGNKGDTFYSGTGNSTLTGGTGADMFVHEGGRDVITDYLSGTNKVRLTSGNMGDISGIKVDTAGATLTFGDNGSIVLQGIGSTDKVTFASAIDTYGTGYFFANGSVKTAAGYGVTLTTEQEVDINNDTKLDTVIANAGGTIIGGTRTATLGGSNVNIVAGDGKETFLYKGGNMNISGYGSTDKVSLMSGYTVTDNKLDEDNKKFELTVTNGTATQTITFEGAEAKSFKTVKVNDATITIPYTPEDEPMIFDRSNPAGAENVSVNVQTADFGVFSVDETVPSDSIGSEYYASLVGITATKEDSTIVGNSKANTFNVAGGTSNILTGGLKNDTFIFAAGGGVITDFGINITKNGANKYLASTTKRTAASTYVGYNRTNPLSYAQGTDVLKVDGTVVEIAFRQDGGDYDSSTESSFKAYVTYVAGGKYSTIALANIHKHYTATDRAGDGANAIYEHNATAAGRFDNKSSIYDTSTGTSAQLTGTALTDLFVDKSNSAHSSAIAALDAIIQARGITTYSTTAPYYIASVSNGIVAK